MICKKLGLIFVTYRIKINKSEYPDFILKYTVITYMIKRKLPINPTLILQLLDQS